MADTPKKEYEAGSFGEEADNANKGIYAKDSFGASNAAANKRVLPDINPADRAVAAMLRHSNATSLVKPLIPPPGRDHEFDGRIVKLEDLVKGILDALNSATITAVCNSDSTITITLTLPGLPG